MKESALHKIKIFVYLPMIALNVIGVMAIASTKGGFQGSNFPEKQIVFILISLIASLLILKLPFSFFKKNAYFFYLVGLLLLIYVHFFGKKVNGAQSWIYLGPGIPNLQPSEFMKYFLILALAQFLMYRESYHRWRDITVPFILTSIPMLLILKQPDLGSALIYMPLLFTFAFVLGFKLRNILMLMFLGSMLIVCVWNFTNLIRSYQKDRVLAFWYPEDYKDKEAYQLQSSLMAIGDGGLLGKGYRQGTIHAFEKLPESHTDFIFAVICEDFGLVGGGLIFSLYLFLLYNLIALMGQTREPFPLCVILGVSIIMFYQVVINMTVVLGLMPTTGVTLPLVSYGGSSVLANYIGVSIAVNASYSNEFQSGKSQIA